MAGGWRWRNPAGRARLRTGDRGLRDLADARRFAPHGAAGQPCASRQGAGLPGFRRPGHAVFLGRGRLETVVTAQRGPAARYQVRTPTAVVGVRGTAFPGGRTCAAGSAQAEVTGGEVRMSPPAQGLAATALPAGLGPSPGQARPSRRRARCCAAPAARRRAVAVLERVAMQFPFAAVEGRCVTGPSSPATRLSTTW